MGRHELLAWTACGIAALSLLAGCGQRGPLTLPEEPVPGAAPQDDESQDDEQEQDAQG